MTFQQLQGGNNLQNRIVMSIKITKCAYTKLIKEDLDWLNKECPAGLEKDHIEAVLRKSIDLLYPRDENFKVRCPYCGSTKVIMFDADNDMCNKCGKYFPSK